MLVPPPGDQVHAHAGVIESVGPGPWEGGPGSAPGRAVPPGSGPGRHGLLGVAGAEAAGGQDVTDGGEVGVGEGDVGGAGVLLGAAGAADAGDGHDVLAPGQRPRSGAAGALGAAIREQIMSGRGGPRYKYPSCSDLHA
jgi:hypothetical protein